MGDRTYNLSFTLSDGSSIDAGNFVAPQGEIGPQGPQGPKGDTGESATISVSKIYGVGAIYISIQNVSPASFLGGTWEKLSAGYTLWTASSGAGTTVSAGLPNITGSFDIFNTSGATKMVDGASNAFSAAYKNSTSVDTPEWSSTKQTGRQQVSFDASDSNSIYGNSTTVQPPAIKVYMWKRTA